MLTNPAKIRALALMVIALITVLQSATVNAASSSTSTSGISNFLYSVNGFDTRVRFRDPSAIAVDLPHNLVYVCDKEDKLINAFSIQGSAKFRIGEKGELDSPAAIAVDKNGELYVSEPKLCKIKVFDTQNRLSAEIDLSKLDSQVKAMPGRMTFSRDNELFVVDQANQQILVFDRDGKFKFKFGKFGDRLGEFRTIEDVAVDRQGRIYVVDSSGIPVQIFDKRGQYITRIGTHTDTDTGLVQPVALMVDKFDQIWVVDTAEHCVKVFGWIGSLLRTFGQYGTVERSFFYPVDIDIDSFGRVYVLEKGSRRFQVFELQSPYKPLTER